MIFITLTDAKELFSVTVYLQDYFTFMFMDF